MASPEEADEQVAEITPQDVESLNAKLMAFAETLTDNEQDLLENMLSRAAGEEVQGFRKKRFKITLHRQHWQQLINVASSAYGGRR
ncbi:MAG: hypothetical protein HY691_00065 [Chloroflexi bacterium]|nr:hypothetical protein [Chloroflexota bacterium]